MSETNNDDSFANVIAELGSKLKDEFSNEMKSSINDLSEKMDLTKKETDGLTNISDFVQHLNECDNPNCEIHKSINTTANNSYMKGFLLGAKYGKQKRS